MENKKVKVGGALAIGAAAIFWLERKRRDGSMQPLFESMWEARQSAKAKARRGLLTIFDDRAMLKPEEFDRLHKLVATLLDRLAQEDAEKCDDTLVGIYEILAPESSSYDQNLAQRRFLTEIRAASLNLTSKRADLLRVLRRWETNWLEGRNWLPNRQMVLADTIVQVGLWLLQQSGREIRPGWQKEITALLYQGSRLIPNGDPVARLDFLHHAHQIMMNQETSDV